MKLVVLAVCAILVAVCLAHPHRTHSVSRNGHHHVNHRNLEEIELKQVEDTADQINTKMNSPRLKDKLEDMKIKYTMFMTNKQGIEMAVKDIKKEKEAIEKSKIQIRSAAKKLDKIHKEYTDAMGEIPEEMQELNALCQQLSTEITALEEKQRTSWFFQKMGANEFNTVKSKLTEVYTSCTEAVNDALTQPEMPEKESYEEYL